MCTFLHFFLEYKKDWTLHWMCIFGDKGKDNQPDSIFSLLYSANKGPGQYNLRWEIQLFGTSIFCQFYSYAKLSQLKSCLQCVDSLETRKDFRLLATFDPWIILHVSIASKIVRVPSVLWSFLFVLLSWEKSVFSAFNTFSDTVAIPSYKWCLLIAFCKALLEKTHSFLSEFQSLCSHAPGKPGWLYLLVYKCKMPGMLILEAPKFLQM